MIRLPHLIGVGLGLVAAGSLLPLVAHTRTTDSGRILSECDGALSEIVVHYDPSAWEAVVPVYRALLSQLAPEVRVHAICPDAAAWSEFRLRLGPVECSVNPVIVNHPMTTWSRDRWVALAHEKGGRTSILSPRSEDAGEIWPARAGDSRVGTDLARAPGNSVAARRSAFYFDGGDLLADSDRVFVVPRVLGRNIQHTAWDQEEFLRGLSLELNRPLLLLDRAPDHHAGMFMASIGNRTVLVGDPDLGKPLFAAALERQLPVGHHLLRLVQQADFSAETQALFDSVAEQCRRSGYRVVRIPTVLGRDGRTYLTYVNALIDRPRSGSRVYLPVYEGAPELNDAAQRIWQDLGFEVRPVDCTAIYPHFGCLHCLVNVLRRTK